MALTEAQKAKCIEWVKGYANKWQTASRGTWKYQFHEKTLVRFIADVTVREDLADIILEYLTSDDCIETLSLYDQKVDKAWKPIRAWYELGGKSAGSIGGMRLMHAMTIGPDAGADGPYVTENGCFYKVNLTYYWKKPDVAPLPESSSGVNYQISGLSRDNETGLFSYAVEERIRIEKNIPEYLMRHTLYDKTSEEDHLGVKSAIDPKTEKETGVPPEDIGQAASYGNGKIVTRKITKNPDCTFDIHNDIVEDQKVENAQESVAVDVRGVVTTVEHSGMTNPLDLTIENIPVGVTRTNEKMPSGLWKHSIRTFTAKVFSWIKEGCTKNLFAWQHTKVTSTDGSNLEKDASGNPIVKVPEAAGGVIVETDIQKTDYGYDVATQTTTEKEVTSADVVTRKTLRGTVTSTTNRNQNKAEAVTGLKKGDTVKTERTPGGLYNNTKESFAANDQEVVLVEECSKTLFEHTDETLTATGTKPTTVEVTDIDKLTKKGVVTTQVVRETEEGFDVTKRVVNELSVDDAIVSKVMTRQGLRVQTTDLHQNAAGQDPIKIGQSMSYKRTPGGLYDITSDEVPTTAGGDLDETNSEDEFKKENSKTVNSLQEDKAVTYTSGEGVVVTKRSNITESGTYDNTTHTVTAKASRHDYDWEDETGSHHKVVFVNQPSSLAQSVIPNDADTSDANERKNEFGLYDGTLVWTYRDGSADQGETSAIKQGAPVVGIGKFRKRRPWGYHQVKTFTIQLFWYLNGAYTSYINDTLSANISRKDQGIIVTKLISSWVDGAGTRKAEWVAVKMTDSTSDWEDYDPSNPNHTKIDIVKTAAIMIAQVSNKFKDKIKAEEGDYDEIGGEG